MKLLFWGCCLPIYTPNGFWKQADGWELEMTRATPSLESSIPSHILIPTYRFGIEYERWLKNSMPPAAPRSTIARR